MRVSFWKSGLLIEVEVSGRLREGWKRQPAAQTCEVFKTSQVCSEDYSGQPDGADCISLMVDIERRHAQPINN